MRPVWSEYFLRLAEVAATRATCPRLAVGCVLADRDHQVIATGYNGGVSGLDHCLDAGCILENGRCVRANHAEQNAIIQAARRGVSTVGAACYVTHQPCFVCFRHLLAAGVRQIVYRHPYGETLRTEYTAWAHALSVDFRHRPGVTRLDKGPSGVAESGLL